MITNQPCCDWLTITTFDARESIELFNLSSAVCKGESKQAAVRGYEGKQWENGFWGVGEQRDKRHYMMNLWGYPADEALFLLKAHPGQCKRIDLQITIPLPADYDAMRLDESLRDESIPWGGRMKTINTIKGHPKGMDTVYIGSWHSDVFARVYVKLVDGQRWLRYEQVYKGHAAQPVFERVAHWGTPEIGRVLHNEILILPDVPHLKRFREILLGYDVGVLVRGERVKDDDATLSWLKNQVMPTLARVSAEEERGRPIRAMIRDLVGSWDRLADLE